MHCTCQWAKAQYVPAFVVFAVRRLIALTGPSASAQRTHVSSQSPSWEERGRAVPGERCHQGQLS